MSQARSYQKASLLVVIIVLSASMINTMGGLVNPAIATLAATYPDVSLSTIQLSSTLPMLAGLPVSFFAGKIIGKLGPKKAMILSYSIFMIANVIPTFFRTDFIPILVCRVISGFVSGVVAPLTATLVNTYIEFKRRPSMFGYMQSLGSAIGVVLTSLVGIIAVQNVFNIWYLHLVLLIPICLGIMLPKAPEWEEEAVASKAEPEESRANGKGKIPFAAWMTIVLMFLFSVFSYPAFLYISSLIAANGMGDAALSGFVTSASTVGGVLGTLLFGRLYKKLGKNVLPIFMLLLVVNYFLFAFTKSPALYLLANFIGGIGYFCLFVSFNTSLSVNCSPATFQVAAGIMAAIKSIGIFLSSYIMDFISGIAGQAGNFAFPFIICGVVFIVIAGVLLVKPLKM